MKNYRIWILGGLAVFVVLACIFLYERAHASFHDIENGGTEAMNYKSITMEEAKHTILATANRWTVRINTAFVFDEF